jgi:outer membrane protein TolC
MKSLISFILFLPLIYNLQGKNPIKEPFSFEVYLGYVKKHHPLVKQANLTLNVGEANLLKARGGFDPKVEVDYNTKEFKNTEYYNELNATFKVPLWYGIELKGNFENNTGDFLDPSMTVPEEGLYSAGVSVSLAQGLLMNDRMATLKKAKFFKEQSKADRDLLVNEILYEASIAYFNWLQAYNEEQIYTNFLDNASRRLEAVKQSYTAGDKAAIDTLEAKITVQNWLLGYETTKLKRQKAGLQASTFLWIEGVPLEFEESVVPELPTEVILNNSLSLQIISADSIALDAHPKLRSLDYKMESLQIDRRLKSNRLLPKLDVQYNFLASDFEQQYLFNTSNYKAMVNFSLPIFLRKERGDLKLAKLKLQDINYEITSSSLAIKNKITAVKTEIVSLNDQQKIVQNIVKDYTVLLKGEERKFFLGESSLFLINSREQSLITSQLKENEITVKRLSAMVKLFNVMGLTPLTNLN